MFNITALQAMYAWLNNEYVLEGAIYDFLGFEANYFVVIELRNFPSIFLLVQFIWSKTTNKIAWKPQSSIIAPFTEYVSIHIFAYHTTIDAFITPFLSSFLFFYFR